MHEDIGAVHKVYHAPGGWRGLR